MLLTNRKTKNRRKKIVQILLFLFFISGVSVTGSYFFISQLTQKHVLVSPLAQTVLGENTTDDSEITYIEEQLAKEQIALKTVIASASSYLLVFPDGSEALFSSQKSLASQISSLQFITRQLTMEGRRFHRLDLRFEKPVVVF